MVLNQLVLKLFIIEYSSVELRVISFPADQLFIIILFFFQTNQLACKNKLTIEQLIGWDNNKALQLHLLYYNLLGEVETNEVTFERTRRKHRLAVRIRLPTRPSTSDSESTADCRPDPFCRPSAHELPLVGAGCRRLASDPRAPDIYNAAAMEIYLVWASPGWIKF